MTGKAGWHGPALAGLALAALLCWVALRWYPPTARQPSFATERPAFFPAGTARPNAVALNTAPWQELAALPGIGEKKARAIVLYRQQNGPFQTPRTLLEVEGIGEKTLESIISLVFIDENGSMGEGAE